MSPFLTQIPPSAGGSRQVQLELLLVVVTIRGGYTDGNFTTMSIAQSGMLGLNVISGMLSVENLAMQ